MQRDPNKAFSQLSAGALRQIKYSAITISALMLAGIAALMVVSRGKGEDITGIVAPALLITFLSSVVATIAAVFQKRAQKAIDLTSEKRIERSRWRNRLLEICAASDNESYVPASLFFESVITNANCCGCGPFSLYVL